MHLKGFFHCARFLDCFKPQTAKMTFWCSCFIFLWPFLYISSLDYALWAPFWAYCAQDFFSESVPELEVGAAHEDDIGRAALPGGNQAQGEVKVGPGQVEAAGVEPGHGALHGVEQN